MDLHVWTAYLVAMSLISISPGSGALLTMTHSMARGVKGVWPGVLGLQAGLLIVLMVSGLGLGALLLASEQAFSVLKWAGAAYLFGLGVAQWRAASHEAEQDPASRAALAQEMSQSTTSLNASVPLSRLPAWRLRVTADTPAFTCFVQGLLTNVSNPKGIVFMVAVLPQFLDPARALGPQLAVCALTSVAVDVVVMRLGYAHVAAGLQRLLQGAQARRVRDRLFGGVLMALGVSLVFVKRSSG